MTPVDSDQLEAEPVEDLQNLTNPCRPQRHAIPLRKLHPELLDPDEFWSVSRLGYLKVTFYCLSDAAAQLVQGFRLRVAARKLYD